MELSKAKIPTSTCFEIKSPSGEMTGVYVTAHTPDSKEWRTAQKVYAPKGQEHLSMQVRKKGDSVVQLPNDPNAYDNRIKRLSSVTINIEGLTENGQPLEMNADKILALYSDDGMAWFVDAVEDHLEERSNFLGSVGKTANSTSGASAGSTPAPIDLG